MSQDQLLQEPHGAEASTSESNVRRGRRAARAGHVGTVTLLGRHKGETESAALTRMRREGRTPRFRALFPADPATGRRVTVPGGPWRSRVEAERALVQAVALTQAGVMTVPAVRGPSGAIQDRVTDVVTEFIEDRIRLGRALATTRNYRTALRCHINDPSIVIVKGGRRTTLGDVPLSRLDSLDVEEWLTALAMAGRSRSVINAAKRCLSAAVGWHLVRTRSGRVNPVKTARSPGGGKSAKSGRVVPVPPLSASFDDPGMEQVARLTLAVENRRDRLMALTLAWAGPRLAEAAALDSRSLVGGDHDLVVWRVIQQVEPGRGNWAERQPKTGRMHTAVMPAALRAALVELALSSEEHPLWGRLLFPKHTAGSPRGGSGVWDASSWESEVWAGAQTSAGVSATTKSLRAYAASALWAAGGTDAECQDLLGHTDPSTTRRHYLHIQNDVRSDPERLALRLRPDLTVAERLDALWDLSVRRYGDPLR